MMARRSGTRVTAGICGALVAVLCATSAFAYPTWSVDPATDTGNCAGCHGQFGYVRKKYVSLHDGTVWTGDLMTGHGSSMMVGCLECHQMEGDQPHIARCTGCHGREEDAATTQKGAGLRERHRTSGIDQCDLCHGSGEAAVGENVIPANMARKGIDPCNDAQFGPEGLDNDGDGLYDGADPDCR